ncbi:MAG: hypothetical protein PUP91_30970 [Rhizonema sp. PD37]|nr:hypothetical protein [Rhizonema sp. PD37]
MKSRIKSRSSFSRTYINHAHNPDEVVKGYEMMAQIRKDFTILPILPFD